MKQTQSELEKLLQTKDRVEQAQRVQGLLSMAGAPVVDIVIRADGRNGNIGITLIGPDLGIQDVYKILDAAREILHQQELKAASAKKEELPTSKDEVKE